MNGGDARGVEGYFSQLRRERVPKEGKNANSHSRGINGVMGEIAKNGDDLSC